MKPTYLLASLAVAVALTACTSTPSQPSPSRSSSGTGTVETNQITYTDSGFEPVSISVTRGTTVTFVRDSSRNMQPASVVHPTHREYPTNTGECGPTHFDACESVDSYSFTFNEVGMWRYHNHFRPTDTGTVTVTE